MPGRRVVHFSYRPVHAEKPEAVREQERYDTQYHVLLILLLGMKSQVVKIRPFPHLYSTAHILDLFPSSRPPPLQTIFITTTPDLRVSRYSPRLKATLLRRHSDVAFDHPAVEFCHSSCQFHTSLPPLQNLGETFPFTRT